MTTTETKGELWFTHPDTLEEVCVKYSYQTAHYPDRFYYSNGDPGEPGYSEVIDDSLEWDADTYAPWITTEMVEKEVFK